MPDNGVRLLRLYSGSPVYACVYIRGFQGKVAKVAGLLMGQR